MYLVDLLGALLTLLALGFLALGGYLAALRLLGTRATSDPLALAVATLLLALGEATAIALLLGSLGLLRIDLAMALQLSLVLALLLDLRRRLPPGGVAVPLLGLARRASAVAREHWAASLLALHAVGSESLRGLLRPPLSWDALMYHLVLAGTWLRDQDLRPVFGGIPVNYYGYVPANGSLWFWWWMAPSHSEIYVNLASLVPWLLLALAAGGIARELGARRHWPLASFLTALTPTVVRFAATEYVDLFLAGALLGGLFFALRWLRDPAWASALLFGVGLGLAAGSKVLGVAYGLAAGGAIVLVTRGSWGRRAAQLAAVVALTIVLGGYFYARDVAIGAGPLAIACEQEATGPAFAHAPTFPRQNSVLQAWPEMMAGGRLLEAFLGTAQARRRELGVGPQAFLLLAAALALPWLVGRDRRREGAVAAILTWAVLAFWLAVPFSRNGHIYANVRYLVPAIALAFAAAITFVERRGLNERLLAALTVTLLAQDVLQLHAEMPLALRVAMGAADVAAVALFLAPRARAVAARRWRELAVVGAAAAIAAAPLLVRFRLEDRARALASDITVHQTVARFFANGWAWLDAYAGSGNVAVSHAPNTYLPYPIMGPRLERDARYVNINDADLPYAVQYRGCQPRVDPSPRAWVRNLVRQRIRWVYLARLPSVDFPLEARWMEALPQLFTPRYADSTNRVYELILPPAASPPAE